ncbi:MAG: sigma-54 dependent transcriptional regulator [Gemmataceae bacterium]|nr:sigma-54 dependent transcriptional regulator [Gemmataceae bacterium]
MPKSTAALISNDHSLIQAIHDITSSLANLRLEILPALEGATALLQRDDLALLLPHVTQDDTVGVSQLLRAVAAARKAVPTVVLSEHYQAEKALALLRQGAADYLARPLDLARLAYLTDTLTLRSRYTGVAPVAAPAEKVVAAARAVATREVESMGEENPLFYMPDSPMAALMDQVKRVARQEATILLTGETGTGKTRLARLIHALSPRCNQPLMVVNCAALSPTLIESELFGHEKGSFTGADRARTGKFADAGLGTLVLDELDALPPELQAKLLRAVDERVFEPVGSNHPQPVRARLIAATNRVLEEEVAAKRFRQDLYYRLNVVAFYLPPLRDRPGLVQPLIAQLLAEFATRNDRTIDGIRPEALELLERYPWPGNIRELRNTIERAVVLCPGAIIQVDDLPDSVRAHKPAAPSHPLCQPSARPGEGSQPGKEAGSLAEPRPAVTTPLASLAPEKPEATLAEAKEAAEAERIWEALRKHNNNKLRAAEELGISRMTLYKKLHRYNLMNAALDGASV